MNIEKHKDLNKCKKKHSPKDYSDKIFEELNKVISNNSANLEYEFQHIEDKIFKVIKRNDINNWEIQDKIFNQILYFYNNLFWKIKLRKIYNNIPKTNIEEFAKKNIWTQIFNSSYQKERWNSFIQKNIEWAWCWNWAIIFKKTFDKFQKLWLHVKTHIFKYDWPHWHAWITINFQWKDYIMDLFWINEEFNWHQIITNIDDLNKNWWNILDIFRYCSIKDKQNEIQKNIFFFDNIEDYIKHQKFLTPQKATFEFNIWTWKDKQHIKLDFLKDCVYLEIQNEKFQFFLNESFIKNKDNLKDLSDEEFYKNFILQWLYERKKTIKWTILLKRYSNLIKDKINLSYFRKIYDI